MNISNRKNTRIILFIFFNKKICRDRRVLQHNIIQPNHIVPSIFFNRLQLNTSYLMRFILKKILSSAFNFYFALNFGHFQFLQKCLNSRPQWYKACITSEILIRDDIIFGLKIAHKAALPSIILISFTSLCQLHYKPRQKHRKSSFLWSIICPKWPKFTIRCHGNHFVLRGKWILYPLYTRQNTSYIKIWGKSERCHVQPSLVAM